MIEVAKLAWVIPLFPLVSFLVLISIGQSSRFLPALFGLCSSAFAFCGALIVYLTRLVPDALDYYFAIHWMDTGRFSLKLGFEITEQNALLLVIVAGVQFFLQCALYRHMRLLVGITHHRLLSPSFWASLALLQFATLWLMIADNLFSLLLFWEFAAISAFLLLGGTVSGGGRQTAVKAFYADRISGLSLLLLVISLWWRMPQHVLDFNAIHTVFEARTAGVFGAISVAPACLLLVAIGAKLWSARLYSIQLYQQRRENALVPVSRTAEVAPISVLLVCFSSLAVVSLTLRMRDVLSALPLGILLPLLGIALLLMFLQPMSGGSRLLLHPYRSGFLYMYYLLLGLAASLLGAKGYLDWHLLVTVSLLLLWQLTWLRRRLLFATSLLLALGSSFIFLYAGSEGLWGEIGVLPHWQLLVISSFLLPGLLTTLLAVGKVVIKATGVGKSSAGTRSVKKGSRA